MNILITGAQFDNKGAQSLLFSVVNEISTRYGKNSINVYYVPVDDIRNYHYEDYYFKFVFDDCYGSDCIDIGRRLHRAYSCYKRSLIIRRELKEKSVLKLSECWDKIDLHIDISGFTLSSKWPAEINNRILRYIDNSYEHNIPVILMPQSFGPFDFSNKEAYLDKRIETSLKKVLLICAREKDGKRLLESKYGIKDHVKLYPDLVLVSSEIDPTNLFKHEYFAKSKIIKTNGNVGIIPNEQLLISNSKDSVLNVYKAVIDSLVKQEKNVYIFRHSKDFELCKAIYNYIGTNNPNVHLISEEFDCIEFSSFVKQFDFVVASRFHSIVHSYKNFVPAVIIGWSIKYQELAELFNQEKYVIDINKISTSDVEIDNIIELMSNSFRDEKDVISINLSDLKNNSCYNELWNIIDKLI